MLIAPKTQYSPAMQAHVVIQFFSRSIAFPSSSPVFRLNSLLLFPPFSVLLLPLFFPHISCGRLPIALLSFSFIFWEIHQVFCGIFVFIFFQLFFSWLLETFPWAIRFPWEWSCTLSQLLSLQALFFAVEEGTVGVLRFFFGGKGVGVHGYAFCCAHLIYPAFSSLGPSLTWVINC